MVTSSKKTEENPKPVETIIVTRHQGLIDWLAKQGITGEVKASVTAEDIEGKHVYGALPAHIAQHALYMTSVDYSCPFEKRGKHLTAEDLDELGAKLFSYKVIPVVEVEHK